MRAEALLAKLKEDNPNQIILTRDKTGDVVIGERPIRSYTVLATGKTIKEALEKAVQARRESKGK